jgi:membrane protein DedA with SNARE-associated domain
VIESELLHYGYLFVFAGTIVEGDATLLTAAFLAHRGYFKLSWVLLIAALSTAAASHVYYLIARRNGPALLETVGKGNAKLERIVAWSRRSGGLLLVGSRFMIGLRTLIPVVCGATGMSASRFIGWNVTGAVLWAAAFGSAGYLGGHLVSAVVGDIRRHERLLAGILGAATLGYVLWRTHGREIRDIWLLGRRALGKRTPN